MDQTRGRLLVLCSSARWKPFNLVLVLMWRLIANHQLGRKAPNAPPILFLYIWAPSHCSSRVLRCLPLFCASWRMIFRAKSGIRSDAGSNEHGFNPLLRC